MHDANGWAGPSPFQSMPHPVMLRLIRMHDANGWSGPSLPQSMPHPAA